MLLYYPQYCIASVGAMVILLFMYGMKRNYHTRKNRIFLIMLIDNLAASAINILTFYVISFPERYPKWLSISSNLLYLFLYTGMAVLFLLYADSLTKIPFLKTPIAVLALIFLLYNGGILLTSPLTHLVAYFDENMIYQHGPLMVSLYIIAFICMVIGMALIIARRKLFNFYQVFAALLFSLGIFISVIFQLFHPDIVITNFVSSLALFFVYTAFENQAYYLYGDTPCYNRRAFVRTVHECWKRNKAFVVTAIRMEDFENIVRSMGRNGAEFLTERIAERLSREFGTLAYCIDVNCFVVYEDAEHKIRDMLVRIESCFSEPIYMESGDQVLTITTKPSITVLPVRDEHVDGAEMADLLQKLEESGVQEGMVQAVSLLLAPMRREQEVLHVIDKTIRLKAFQVFYQPILDVETGRFTCAEALVRMIDEKAGIISPEEFIPIAEKNGRIKEIGDFVFREVCRFIRDSGIQKLGVDYIEVNLSPAQCRDKELEQQLKGIMQEYQVRPEQLNLEITETAEMNPRDMKRLSAIMQSMNSDGVTFSLDDFGSGFSAIKYLIRLPVDIVKIDKDILWQSMDDATSMTVLQNTIRMIQQIGRKVVVEGVETEEMARTLRNHGCNYMQGFLYSKPLPEMSYIDFLEKSQEPVLI